MDEKEEVFSKLLCMACLCDGRDLYLLKADKLRMYYLDALSQTHPMQLLKFQPQVCWECYYLIQKAVAFKERIQDSYWLLKTYMCESLKDNILVDVARPPRLKMHHNQAVSIPPNQDSKPDDDLVVMKDEGGSWDVDRDYGDDLWTNEEKCPLYENAVEIEIETNVKLKKEKRKRKDKGKKGKKSGKRLKSGKKAVTTGDLTKSNHIKTIELSYEEMLAERLAQTGCDKFRLARYQCESCIIGFSSERMMASHNDTKHPKEGVGISCPVCHVVTASLDSFTHHYNRHMRRYECVTCHKRTVDLKMMKQHYYTAHKISLKEYKCNICGHISKSVNQHKYHSESHKSRVPCKDCDKTFSHRAGLVNHRLVAHESRNKFPCDVCNKVFQWKTSLKRHKEIHEISDKDKDAAAYCSTCDLSFAFVSSYRRHLKNSLKHVSQNELKYICDHCGRRFADKTKLRDHIESKHMQKSYQCHICHKPSKNRVCLEQHIRNVHKGRPNDKICHHCGKGFPTKLQLECHIRTHTGERPFICEYCPTTFSQQSNLYKHNRQVHLNIKSKRYPPCKKKEEKPPAGPMLEATLAIPYKDEPISIQFTHDREFIM